MDRRQRKTRECIFEAFTELLSQKDVYKITVGEIIEKADVGRATFYAHFPTKDYLIKDLNEELFCHVFDSLNGEGEGHKHIFGCQEPRSAYLHLFKHFQNNDNGILDLLSSPNNELFLHYFKKGLVQLINKNYNENENVKNSSVPKGFWVNHLATTFVETVKWWVENGQAQTPEEITRYYLAVIGENK